MTDDSSTLTTWMTYASDTTFVDVPGQGLSLQNILLGAQVITSDIFGMVGSSLDAHVREIPHC